MSRLRPDHVGLKYFYIFPSKKNHLPIGEMIDGTLISENTPSAFKIVDRDVFVNIYTVINKKTGVTKRPFSAFVTLFLVFNREKGETHV